jgi:hypothetical protein
MAMQEYKLEYELGRDDLVAYSGFQWATAVLRKWILYPVAAVFGGVVGVLVIAVLYGIVFFTPLDWPIWMFGLFPLMALVGIFFAVKKVKDMDKDELLTRLTVLVTKDFSKTVITPRQQSSLGDRTVTVTPSYIEITGPKGTKSVALENIKYLASTNNHIFILTEVGIIIPNTAFASQSKYAEFYIDLRKWCFR